MKKSKLLVLLPVLLLSLSACSIFSSTTTSGSSSSEKTSEQSEESSTTEDTKEETTSDDTSSSPDQGGEENPGEVEPPENYTYTISVTNLEQLTSFEVGDSKDINISLYSDDPLYSGSIASQSNIVIILDNAYMTIYDFTLTATYPGVETVSLSWVESGITLASTSFTVLITGEARTYVYNPVLSFSITFGGVNQTIPAYAEAYVIGDWNDWEPIKLEESSSQGSTTYNTTLDALMVNESYNYQLVLLYAETDASTLDNEQLYAHRLTSGNQSFNVHADNQDGYVYNLVVQISSELSSIIPQKTFNDVSITFHIYMHDDTEHENELTPLDSEYATLYIYGFTGEEFAACTVKDNHYVLHLDTVEAGTYNYSALLYYADQDLPEDIDQDFWEAHKVNDGVGSRVGDEQYTIDASFVSDGSSIDAYFYSGTPLEDLVPDRTVYTKTNVTINFTITVVDTTSEVSPLDYGTLYIYGLTGGEFIACEQDEDTGKYFLTIDEIDAGTYKYSALIYYSDQELPEGAASDSEFWGKYKVNTGENGDGLGDETLVIEKDLAETGATINTSFEAIKPLEEILEDLRVYEGAVSITFNIRAYESETLETALDYGTLYIYGFTGTDLAKCEVENGQYVLHLDSLRAGTYNYSALIYYSDEDLPAGAATDAEFWEKYKVNDGEWGYGQGDETLEVSYESLVASSGAITSSFIAAQSLADILPAKLSSLTLEFHMWYNNEASEQYALSYMTCYFYSSEYDPDNFIECYISESSDGNHYCVDLPDLTPGQYSYSLILLYNDSGIEPDPADPSIWNYKINNGEYGMGVGDNYFTIDVDASSPLEIDLACRYHLSEQFPNNATYTNYTLSITLQDSEGNFLTCPEYGSIYIAGSFDADGDDWKLNKVTSTETSYTYTIDEVYLDHEYFFDLFFVYEGENPSGDYMITNTATSFTPSETEGCTYEVTITLDHSLEVMFPSHDESNLLKDYTIYFDIYKMSDDDGVEYVQKTNPGASVFMNGTVPGANWGDGDQVFLACSYNDTYYGSDHPVYEITFDEIYAGVYTYKLVLNDYNYPGWYNEITSENLTLIVSVEDECPVIITIESNIWFDNYWPGY